MPLGAPVAPVEALTASRQLDQPREARRGAAVLARRDQAPSLLTRAFVEADAAAVDPRQGRRLISADGHLLFESGTLTASDLCVRDHDLRWRPRESTREPLRSNGRY